MFHLLVLSMVIGSSAPSNTVPAPALPEISPLKRLTLTRTEEIARDNTRIVFFMSVLSRIRGFARVSGARRGFCYTDRHWSSSSFSKASSWR